MLGRAHDHDTEFGYDRRIKATCGYVYAPRTAEHIGITLLGLSARYVVQANGIGDDLVLCFRMKPRLDKRPRLIMRQRHWHGKPKDGVLNCDIDIEREEGGGGGHESELMRRFGFRRGGYLPILTKLLTYTTKYVQASTCSSTSNRDSVECLTTCLYWIPVTIHLRGSPTLIHVRKKRLAYSRRRGTQHKTSESRFAGASLTTEMLNCKLISSLEHN